MKWVLVCFGVLASLGSLPNAAYGQGLIHRLPEDGTWSKYRVTQQVHRIRGVAVPEGVPKAILDTLPKAGFAESFLTISSVGKEQFNGQPCRWIELCLETKQRDILLRLLVPEAHLAKGDDAFDHATRVLFQCKDSIDGLHGEILDPKRRAYELERFRPHFPRVPEDAERVANVTFMALTDDAPLRGELLRFEFAFSGALTGGKEGSWSHKGKYQVNITDRAPFGVEQLWMIQGTTTEDTGLVLELSGSEQVVLIESGKNAKSRYVDPNETEADSKTKS